MQNNTLLGTKFAYIAMMPTSAHLIARQTGI